MIDNQLFTNSFSSLFMVVRVALNTMIETTDAMTPYSPSMRLDYDFHRRMEIYYIYTRPLEIARKAGCPMPKLEMLEAELRFLEDIKA